MLEIIECVCVCAWVLAPVALEIAETLESKKGGRAAK
jgi:hypothetical protein